jgi:hypothetical protein
MAIIKSFPGLRERIRIELTEWGYVIQVYGQTVMHAPTYPEAEQLAAALVRALSEETSPPPGERR